MHIFTLEIGNLTIAPTWYGLMYMLGFIGGYLFLRTRVTWHKKDHLDTLVWYVFLGVLFGGRLGYVLFYNFSYFLEHPTEIIAVWKGGMSFHGGLIGVITSMYLFARRYEYNFWHIADRVAVYIPWALALGRLGNWINQELPGFSPYDGIFPMVIGGIAHFPSPLLEMLLEGIFLGVVLGILYFFTNIKDIPGKLSGVFLIGYATTRLIAEQYRLPDAHIGYIG